MPKNKINIKTKEEIQIMSEGGKQLGKIKASLFDAIKEGASAAKVEDLAVKLIAKAGGEPSFKMVPKYSWATCVNINEGVVHGIPSEKIVFKKGDIVSVDLGMYKDGFHTDTSFTVGIKVNLETDKFLKVGKQTLEKAISKVEAGNRVFDISKTIQENIEKAGYKPIKALVGHGIGKALHEEPQIPCFVNEDQRKNSPEISEGMVFAIEVMYTQGSPDVRRGDDGWTISTANGKIASLFEETIAVTKNGPLVLTD